jgi:ribosomal protein S18 acetylase RimI-like enzyme
MAGRKVQDRAVLIRAATVADARRIAEVEVASRLKAYQGLIRQERLDQLNADTRARDWEQTLHQSAWPYRTMLIAEDGDAAVGMADLCPAADADLDAATTGEIASLYILPSHWGRGVGRRMMTTALQVLIEASYTEAVLWILETNQLASGFYRHLGWQLDGAVEDTVAGDQPIRYVRYHLPLPQG